MKLWSNEAMKQWSDEAMPANYKQSKVKQSEARQSEARKQWSNEAMKQWSNKATKQCNNDNEAMKQWSDEAMTAKQSSSSSSSMKNKAIDAKKQFEAPQNEAMKGQEVNWSHEVMKHWSNFDEQDQEREAMKQINEAMKQRSNEASKSK
jgi:hypothetical protein